ncbi:MAG: rhodanese-like domain-containing protein [Halobacteriales archaeon]
MVEEISAADLKQQLDADDAVQVVDIRQAAEFEAGHIPGAENIPFHEFARSVESHDWGDDIVVVCPLGESSLQAARLLEAYEGVSEDARVANLAGGYEDWDYELDTGAAAVEE